MLKWILNPQLSIQRHDLADAILTCFLLKTKYFEIRACMQISWLLLRKAFAQSRKKTCKSNSSQHTKRHVHNFMFNHYVPLRQVVLNLPVESFWQKPWWNLQSSITLLLTRLCLPFKLTPRDWLFAHACLPVNTSRLFPPVCILHSIDLWKWRHGNVLTVETPSPRLCSAGMCTGFLVKDFAGIKFHMAKR